MDAALDFAGVTADDVLYDLGCNDGTHSLLFHASAPAAPLFARAALALCADVACAARCPLPAGAGRVCIAAASRYGARCVGVELDATAVARATAAVEAGTPAHTHALCASQRPRR